MIREIAGYLAGIAILLSFLPYIRDIFKGKTRPERISWLIWAILGMIAFFSQLAKGASFSLIMTAAQALGDLFIFILAIKWGLGGFLKRDILALIGATLGLVLWYLTNDATVALIMVIFVDASGVVLTIIKSYKQPNTETISTWVLTFLAGLLAAVAVGSWNIILLSFPIYICLAGTSILVAIKLGSRKRTVKKYV